MLITKTFPNYRHPVAICTYNSGLLGNDIQVEYVVSQSVYHRRYSLLKNRTLDFMPRGTALGLQNTYVIILYFISSQNDK